MEQGFRYADFTVIARDSDAYAGILDRAFEERGIPHFMDQPQAIDDEPLMRFVLAALQAVRSGLRTDDILLYLKTGLAGLETRKPHSLKTMCFFGIFPEAFGDRNGPLILAGSAKR